jgi:tetratricopeptide (TPR) repeat protein
MKNAVFLFLGLILLASTGPEAASPPEPSTLMDRARALAMQGRNDEALGVADAAVAAAPEDFGLPVGRGEVLEQMGRAAEAAASYRVGLHLFESWLAGATPEEAGRYLRYHALLLARLGRAPEAIHLVDAELRNAPADGPLLALRCEVRAEANVELPSALADCEAALAIRPGDEGALVARGLVFLRQARWAGAERDFTALLQANPANPDALYGRGLARQGLHERDGATADFAAARRQLFYIDAEFDRRGLRQAPSAPPAN